MKILFIAVSMFLSVPAFAALPVLSSQHDKMFRKMEAAFARTGNRLGDCVVFRGPEYVVDAGIFGVTYKKPGDEYFWLNVRFDMPSGIFNYNRNYYELNSRNKTISYIAASRFCGEGAPFGTYKCNVFTSTVVISQVSGKVIKAIFERKDLADNGKIYRSVCEAK